MMERINREQGLFRRFGPALVIAVIASCKLWSRYPAIYQHGEMWAEMATNFFWTAHTASLLQNLVTLDCGYIPAIPRLIALCTQAFGLPVAHVPYAYTAASALITVSSLCAFALPVFRSLVSSDLARFAVCLGLINAPDFETKTLINVAYNTAIPFFLTLLWVSAKHTISVQRGIWLGLALSLCALSKPHFIAFVPGILFLLPLTIKRRQVGNTTTLVLALLAIGLQTAVLLAHVSSDQAPVPSLAQAATVWGGYINFILLTLAGVSAHATLGSTYWLSMLLTGALGVGCAMRTWRGPMDALPVRVIIVCGGALTVGVGLAVKTGYPFLVDANGFLNHDMLSHRLFYIPTVVIFVCYALLLQGSKSFFIRGPVFLTWMTMTWPYGLTTNAEVASWPRIGASAWQSLVPASPLAQRNNIIRDKYCIPINPYPWHIGNACDFLVYPETLTLTEVYDFAAIDAPFVCPHDAVRGQVNQIGLRLVEGDAGKRSLVALDANMQQVGVARETPTYSNVLTYFNFDAPIAPPHFIVLVESGGKRSRVAMNGKKDAPSWLWLGVRDPV